MRACLHVAVCLLTWAALLRPADLQRISFNHPGLTVDLGVGLWAWPLPMDWDEDGDLDLIVSYNDTPNRAIYFFENPSGCVKLPVFKPPVKVGVSYNNIQISYVDGQPRVLIPEQELIDFKANQFGQAKQIYSGKAIHATRGRIRSNQWKYCDYDGDGKMDLIVGVDDWSEYGWDEGYDDAGRWKMGPGRGFVYWLRNLGSDAHPRYADAQKIEADGKAVEVYAMPSPNFADFDSDGDLDLICGEFMDRLTYFENIGARTEPNFTTARFLRTQNRILALDGCMIVPVAIDWDQDGDVDLVVGAEDGSVALVENSGRIVDGLPEFLSPQPFQQQAQDLRWVVLVTPFSYDWDDDGDEDLICGNASGYIGFIENLDGGDPPRWARPQYLRADGEVIRILAGHNGSIQGPCEAKWGYTTLSVADWDNDGLPDILVNSIWGQVHWYRNIGSRSQPRLACAQPVLVDWEGTTPKPEWVWWKPKDRELVSQWRTTPLAVDFNRDGLQDLVMLDHEGYLAFFERTKDADGLLHLLPGKRLFTTDGPTVFDSSQKPQPQNDAYLRLNGLNNGKSGRRKIGMTDWNGDGRLDLLVNSVNITLMENRGQRDGLTLFHDFGPLAEMKLAGHSTSPAVVDWNKDGIKDLLIGAEDGRFYYLRNPRGRQ
ncbi:VCBS repeat-containing protein [bacterium]|nr:VCBS repeat-containing protein [bacterium]